MLAWTIYVSFLGVLALMLLPKGNAAAARKVALIAALAGCGVALTGFFQHPAGAIVTVVNVPWIPTLGIRYHLAADGISVTLVVLTGLAAVAGILFSWNIEHRAREFFAYYLALIGGVYGVFLSFDLFLLFAFYELAIIPKYFLIAIWGSTRREYGAMKLVLYSLVGSAMVLLGLIAAYVVSGAQTMSLEELAQYPFAPGFQRWAFPLVFAGFAVLAGLWPLHTWAPTGHVAAPTAASMLLAGVVMKLGAYGCLRVAMTVFPGGMENWSFSVLGVHSWRDVIAGLAVIGIVYGALVALAQRDFKFVIGYSSVSHMGFVLLGLATLNPVGLSGAVLQMFSHGIIAGLLFAVVGRMVYDRTHTRELSVLEGLRLSRAMPFAAGTFVIASAASMGLPGFSGFVAELQVLIGAWAAYPGLAIVTGIGILIGVAYTWRAAMKAFFGEPQPPTRDAGRGHEAVPVHPFRGHPRPAGGRGQGEGDVQENRGAMGSTTPQAHPARDGDRADFIAPDWESSDAEKAVPAISVPERLGAVLLIGTTLWVGLYPQALLGVILPSFQSPLFHWLRPGGGL